MKKLNNIINKLQLKPHVIYENSLDIKSNLKSYNNKKGVYLWFNKIR